VMFVMLIDSFREFILYWKQDISREVLLLSLSLPVLLTGSVIFTRRILNEPLRGAIYGRVINMCILFSVAWVTLVPIPSSNRSIRFTYRRVCIGSKHIARYCCLPASFRCLLARD
jgi:hypothetical protein